MVKVLDFQKARCNKIRDKALAYLLKHPAGYAQAVIDMERDHKQVFGRGLTAPDVFTLRQFVIDFFSSDDPPGMVS